MRLRCAPIRTTITPIMTSRSNPPATNSPDGVDKKSPTLPRSVSGGNTVGVGVWLGVTVGVLVNVEVAVGV